MAEVHSSPRQEDLHSVGAGESTGSSLSKSTSRVSPTISETRLDQTYLGIGGTSNNNNNITNYAISRPLSRSSMTSGVSVTATKDGIEGKRVKRRGIPGYSLNLMEKMYAHYLTSAGDAADDDSLLSQDDKVSVESLKSVSISMIPQYSRSGTPVSMEGHDDGGVFGEDTLEFDSEPSTDYERFLQQGRGQRHGPGEHQGSISGDTRSL